MHLCDAVLSLPLSHQCPAPQDCPHRLPKREPLLVRHRDRSLYPFVGRLSLPTEEMEPCSPEQDRHSAVRMRQFFGELQCRVAPLPGLIRITLEVQDERGHAEVGHPGVLW